MHSIKLRYIILLLAWLPPASAWAQLTRYAPARKSIEKTSLNTHARRHAVNPVSLPFWDDFSFARGHRADSLLWIVNEKVFVNDGQAINPPSINVASFDGYNENGVPYSTTAEETGYGDTLESQPIRLGDVPLAQRNNIYLSFFYQAGGNSEMPNPSDFLKLEFKGEEGWKEIHRFRIKSNADPSVFYDTAIQVPQTGDRNYYHNGFQFRFTFFGRLSGPYDAWHLDYVYLNRRVEDNEEALNPDTGNPETLTPTVNEYDKNTNISDRTTTQPFSSILKNGYFSMPFKHFNPGEHLTNPFMYLYSLKDVTFDQVINYTSYFRITNYTNGIPSTSFDDYLDIEKSFDPIISIPSRGHITGQIRQLPLNSNFDLFADSAKVFVKLGLNSGDNDRDYYLRYSPIDFRTNDTLQHTFILSDYYAYDDGVAEYSAGLITQGNQLAYRFVIDENVTQRTLNGAYFYFPFTGSTAPQTMEIFIFPDKNGKPDSASLYRQTIPVTRTANNIFSEVNFTRPVMVRDTFYIGYLETQTGSRDRIRVGLDASHDTGEHLYYRNTVYHPWIQNDRIKGSLMIRPRFGAADIITGIEDRQKPVTIYPNPNRGEFYLNGPVTDVQIITLAGQPMSFVLEDNQESKKITLPGIAAGLYLIRYKSGTKIFTDKILVTEY